MVGATSAAGLVGFLNEEDVALQTFALEQLNEEIDVFWPEVSGSIGDIEALYEDESFPNRELAALVLSKTYYQLGEYNEAMVFALGAGKMFDVDGAEEYEETIIAKIIDTYIALCALHNPPSSTKPRRGSTEPGEGPAGTTAAIASPTMPFSQSVLPSKSLLSREGDDVYDTNAPGVSNAGVAGAHPNPLALPAAVKKGLQIIARRIFESCYEEGEYKQVVGIAIEARNTDVLREAILRSSKQEKANSKKTASRQTDDLLDYVLDICMNVVQERGLRNEILRLILELLQDLPSPDYFAISRCVIYLDQHDMASALLNKLIQKGDGKSLAIAYQLSFDLYENGTQEFLHKVMEALPEVEEEHKMNGDAIRPSTPYPNESDDAQASHQLLTEVSQAASAAVPLRTRSKPDQTQTKAITSIKDILRGTKSIELNLEFLYRTCRTDKAILNKIRDSLEARNSIFHTSVTFANAFMHAGTTIDTFFRDNLEWLQKAGDWSKFSATAALGVIHRGNLSQGQKLLEPYLPKINANPNARAGSTYSQGGSLYGLGLIYTNHGTYVLDYLREQFKATNEEVVQHGGALGIGVAGMATGSEEIYEELKNVLYADSAINGEAVGLSMGLVMLGTGNVKALDDMIQYAHDTQHEKIVRGLVMGMALIMYGRQEAADELINGLLDDADPAIRYGGIFTIALAYCGSGSNKAVRRLLHVAVSDVSDDVRRAAVMSLGFVLFRKPGSVPRMVELLSESYNPHVRYGATMALGIACAGTGLDEAIDLLEPMMKDSVDFVRQGAFIAMAMILVQTNETVNAKVPDIRKHFQKAVGDRHEDALAKQGAALALGIIDCGGRNCTIGLQTQTGSLNMSAIVGMSIFLQYWYWFPFTHCLALSFTPTAVIGIDSDLQVPQFKIACTARASQFAYPPEQEVKTEEAPEKVKTAVLSTTAQAKRRKLAKDRQAGAMDIDAGPNTPKPDADDKMDEDMVVDTSKPEDAPAKKAHREKPGFSVDNMSRVLPQQVKYITFPSEARYQPIKKFSGGVIVMTDSEPDAPKDFVEMKARKKAAPAAPSADATMRDVGAEASHGSGGALAAAGVLTAIDEDEDDAPTPDAFDIDEDAE